MRDGQLPGVRGGVGQDDVLRLLPGERVAEAVLDDAEIVFELRLERKLLDRRDPDVVARLGHRDDRRPVPRDVDHQVGRHLVGPPLAVDQLDLVPPRLVHREPGLVNVVAVLRRCERDGLTLLIDQRRLGDVLVEPERERQLGPLDGGDVADVLDRLGRDRGVAGENELGVGPS